MSDKKKCECPKIEPGAPKWVVTFGDLMSLLLCFFVLLLSFSEMNKQKYKQVAGSMEKAFGVQRKNKTLNDQPKGMKMIAKDFDQDAIATRLKEIIGKQVQEEVDSRIADLKDQIQVESNGEQVTIRMMGESTFDSGAAEIREKLKPLLIKIGASLTAVDGDIIVAGHTDNVPVIRGPFKSNLKLSIARAASVAEFLLSHSTVRPERVSTMGFGEYRPIESNATIEGREKNRRVEIIISTMPRPVRSLP